MVTTVDARVPPGSWATVIHGTVTVLVTGTEPRDVLTVERQLGPLVPAPVTMTRPDVEVRFASRASASGSLVFVGHGETAYDDENFYVTKGKGQTPTLVRMALEAAGDGCCVIECEHGVPAVPLLVALVNISALAHGVLPLHASAVQLGGRTLLVTGWSKGGKTETVLALQRLGAAYVSDEWTYLTRAEDGGLLISGLPEPIRLWAWQLRQLPEVRARILNWPQRARLVALERGASAFTRVGRGRHALGSLSRRLAPIVARQAYRQVPPAELFDNRTVAGPVQLHEVVLAQSWSRDDVVLEPITGDEVAARMVHSLAYERLPLTMVYDQFRFAFPGRWSRTIERASEIEGRLLTELLHGRPAHRLAHPYPPDLDRIGRALQPLTSTDAERRG
jgi:hypothetical protein